MDDTNHEPPALAGTPMTPRTARDHRYNTSEKGLARMKRYRQRNWEAIYRRSQQYESWRRPIIRATQATRNAYLSALLFGFTEEDLDKLLEQ
jgi:DNA-binding transcriptional regulator PaaX